MTQTIARPFDAAITAAKQREDAAKAAADQLREERQAVAARQAQLRKERAEAKAANDQAAAAAATIERELRVWRSKLVDFGRGFVDAVGNKATAYQWPYADCLKVKDYCEKMLLLASRRDDVSLPEISERYAKVVYDKFVYGLELAKRRGLNIPEGFFIGQLLLAEREAAQKAAPEEAKADTKPLRITKTRKAPVRSKRPEVKSDGEIKPAITPPKRVRAPKKDSAPAKA